MRRIATAMGLLALTVFLAARGIDADVYQGGEAREALVAREMLATGDWILPLWNGTVVQSVGQLEGYFGEEAKKDVQPEIHLRPDRRAKYDYVARVLAAAQRNRMKKIGFVNTSEFRD